MNWIWILSLSYVGVSVGMFGYEAWRERRYDPIGCLAWPWWFALYSGRMWAERSRQYNNRRYIDENPRS